MCPEISIGTLVKWTRRESRSFAIFLSLVFFWKLLRRLVYRLLRYACRHCARKYYCAPGPRSSPSRGPNRRTDSSLFLFVCALATGPAARRSKEPASFLYFFSQLSNLSERSGFRWSKRKREGKKTCTPVLWPENGRTDVRILIKQELCSLISNDCNLPSGYLIFIDFSNRATNLQRTFGHLDETSVLLLL